MNLNACLLVPQCVLEVVGMDCSTEGLGFVDHAGSDEARGVPCIRAGFAFVLILDDPLAAMPEHS